MSPASPGSVDINLTFKVVKAGTFPVDVALDFGVAGPPPSCFVKLEGQRVPVAARLLLAGVFNPPAPR